jgi:hypothetical protein
MTVGERAAMMRELIQTSLPVLERDLRVWQRDLEAYSNQSAILPRPDSNPLNRALALGAQKHRHIRSPVLAIFAIPGEIPPAMSRDSASRARYDSISVANQSPQVNAFERGISSARVVRIPHANHYVFRSHEADVLREIRAFISGLSASAVAAEPDVKACTGSRASGITYVVDGKPTTCQFAMTLPSSRIASVDVFKGSAAARYSTFGTSAVIVIETKRDR